VSAAPRDVLALARGLLDPRVAGDHPYELAPTATELRRWLSVVEERVEKAD